MPDAEVLAGSIREPELFGELVDRYQRLFIRKAASILGNEDDAYDAVQEAFVRIYVAARRFKPVPGASFKSWAYAILINRCRTIYAKNKRRNEVPMSLDMDLAEAIPDQSELDRVETRFDTEAVVGALSKLPALLRRVMTLRFVDGLPEKEIAAMEGLSHGAVRTRIYRAKKHLKDINLSLA